MSYADRRDLLLPRNRALARRAALSVVTACILCALLGRIMGYDLRRDEFMFLPPAQLLHDHELYTQLFYNHVPYSAWLFHGIHRLLPDVGLVATGRLTVFAAWLMLLGTAGWLGWRLTGSAVVVGLSLVSLLSADVLLGQTGMAASNNLLPLPFALLGLGLVSVALIERDLSFARLFLAGMMLSLAAGLKVSAFVVIPPVALACFLLPRDLSLSRRSRYLALPVGLGGLVGALPLIWLSVTKPGIFFGHILSYHLGPHVTYWAAHADTEPGLAMDVADKIRLAQTIWLSGASLLAVFIPLAAIALQPRIMSSASWMVVAAMGCAAAVAFVPSPGFPQYYAMPLALLPLLTALLYTRLDAWARESLRPIVLLASALMLLLALPRLAGGLNDLAHPDLLTPARTEEGARAVRDAMVAAGVEGTGAVATLSPLYPLEAGLPIYPEFAAGPFAYRVADLTPPDLRSRYVMAGPGELDALFDARPPAAILTGFDDDLERALVRYAQSHGYRPVDLPDLADRYGSGRLWLPTRLEETALLPGESQ